MTVRVDDDVHEVGVVEAGGCSVERLIVERPRRRPQLPEQPADGAPVLLEARATALGIEVPLVPVSILLRHRRRSIGIRDVLDVVGADRDEAAAALGPERRDDAGGPPAPVVPDEDRAVEVQGVHEREKIGSQRRLLAGPWRRRIQEPGRPVATQPGSEHPTAQGLEIVERPVVGAGIIGKPVHQHDRDAVHRPTRSIGDLERRRPDRECVLDHDAAPSRSAARHAVWTDSWMGRSRIVASRSTSSASLFLGGGRASANQSTATWSSVRVHVPDATPPSITTLAPTADQRPPSGRNDHEGRPCPDRESIGRSPGGGGSQWSVRSPPGPQDARA